MAKIDTTVQKVTTKTMSFAGLKKIIHDKKCTSVVVPLITGNRAIGVNVPKKTVEKDIFKRYRTTDEMFKELEFERVDMVGDEYFISIRII